MILLQQIKGVDGKPYFKNLVSYSMTQHASLKNYGTTHSFSMHKCHTILTPTYAVGHV